MATVIFAMRVTNEVVWQIFFVMIGMQLSLQLAFRFVPNGLKVLALAAILVGLIRFVSRAFRKRTPERFTCDTVAKECEDETECWEETDPNKQIRKILLDTAQLTRDIDKFLEVNVAEV